MEIINGLHAGDKVVTAGQFLIDSEASLRGALPQLAGRTATNDGAAAPAESSGDDGHDGITTPQQADHQAGSHTRRRRKSTAGRAP
ncbi:MAG: hypothetical protein ACR5LG_10785 [Sodalis sp. (in: enterobacteria)]|uniref:hypothetical protein n=1 Tax=Sodalis sp. (in: enterobacteria) TaxID=1898979 RepID=UPI003F30AF36